MSMIYNLRQADDRTIQMLPANPARITLFLYDSTTESEGSDPTNKKNPGLLARLSGSAKEPPAITPRSPVVSKGLGKTSLDKAWHAIHYFLTGSAWEGEFPEGFLLTAGEPIGDIDVGYGPARTYDSKQAAKITKYLNTVDTYTLRSRFDPERMMELEIYPTIWDRDPEEDDTLGYVIAYSEEVKQFVNVTAKNGLGMIGYLN